MPAQDPDSRHFLQQLAENLRTEHIPSLAPQLSGIAYQPSEDEKEVADSFARSHQVQTTRHAAEQHDNRLRAQQSTVAVLSNASRQLEKELTKVSKPSVCRAFT